MGMARNLCSVKTWKAWILLRNISLNQFNHLVISLDDIIIGSIFVNFWSQKLMRFTMVFKIILPWKIIEENISWKWLKIYPYFIVFKYPHEYQTLSTLALLSDSFHIASTFLCPSLNVIYPFTNYVYTRGQSWIACISLSCHFLSSWRVIHLRCRIDFNTEYFENMVFYLKIHMHFVHLCYNVFSLILF